MKSVLILISVATTLATKLVTIPFTAVDRKSLSATSNDKKKQGNLVDVPLENIDLAYLIDVSIGTPSQPFTLLLDTGSSSTWVPLYGCGRLCGYPKNYLVPQNSSTFTSQNTMFNIRYGEGFARGYYAQDTMNVNGASIPEVNFAVSDINDGELTADGADGILGIGPDRLSVYNNPEKKVVPTLVTTMAEKGIIDHNMFSVYFQPIVYNAKDQDQKRINGEIVFGGVEPRHYVGNISYIPVTTSEDFKDYWACDIDSITVGNYTRKYEKKIATMVDTGSTLVFLPRDIISHVFRDVKGLRRSMNGQYIIPCRASNLPDIIITMNGTNFTLKPDHYMITSGSLFYSNDLCYTYLQESPPFIEAILGYGFLQQYVSVYDNENKQIGLAERSTL